MRCGFLLPTDVYRAKGMRSWRRLAQLPGAAKLASHSNWLGSATKTMSLATAAAGSMASGVTRKIKQLAVFGSGAVSDSTSKMLNVFLPQIRVSVGKQMVQKSVSKVKQAVHDEPFMRKVFGAAYDCIPKPVHRFVSEQQFIDYCLQNRRKLLAPGKPLPPPQGSC
jgi:hypothetical protein